MTYRSAPRNTNSFIFGIISMIALLVVFYYLAKIVFNILVYAAPILLIAALVIDYKVVTGYVSWIGSKFRERPLIGLVLTLLSIIGFPLVCLYLFSRALIGKRIKEARQEMETRQLGEYIDYEDITRDPVKDAQRIEQTRRVE